VPRHPAGTEEPAVDREAIAQAVEAERRDLADLLDRLGPADWDVASLCPGWTVRDVVAHLTLTTRLSKPAAVLGVLRARGDVNRLIHDSACRRSAQFGPADLVAQLRATAASTRRPLGARPLDPLVDVLVHGQDIARPLNRSRAMPLARVLPALQHVAGSSFYGVQKRFTGLRFVATDLDWAAGEGTEVRGPGGELLLVLTGRPAGLDVLEGPGVAEAAARLTSRGS
jgi:uncharacterized protein (TIGR03083 family)